LLYALFREGEYDTYCFEEIIYILYMFVGGGLLCYRNIMRYGGINIWVHVLFISKKRERVYHLDFGEHREEIRGNAYMRRRL